MIKRILGFSVLGFVLFAVIITFIKVDIQPSVSYELSASPKEVMNYVSDVSNFPNWDPKTIIDSSVTLNLTQRNGIETLDLTDSTESIVGFYSVENIGENKIEMKVGIQKIEPLTYLFEIAPSENGTVIKWSMNFEGNLMLYLFDAKSQLETMFLRGLKTLDNKLKSIY
ncbi:MAG: SRPBCC family protein [Flavobacteriales bacterium]|nr:SRPBCC family protein [Flavobacteriales bacterium]